MDANKLKRNDPNYYKNYYQKNKEKLLEKATTKIECECGRYVSIGNFNKHLQSRYHETIMKIKETAK